MHQIKASYLASARCKANPYPLYAQLRAETSVYRAPYLGGHVCLVTRYDDVVRALKDERLSKNWRGAIPAGLYSLLRPIARNMLSLDPPDHTRLRAVASKVFTPRMVDRLRERLQSVCDELLDAASTDGRMELIRGLVSPLPLTVIADLLGIPMEHRERFRSWSRGMVEGFFSPVSFSSCRTCGSFAAICGNFLPSDVRAPGTI